MLLNWTWKEAEEVARYFFFFLLGNLLLWLQFYGGNNKADINDGRLAEEPPRAQTALIGRFVSHGSRWSWTKVSD